MKLFSKSLFAILLACGIFLASQVFAQGADVTDNGSSGNENQNNGPGGGNNQVVSSRDAIGLRVLPNPEHFSPLLWYQKNIKLKGAPQSLIVDGYEAVRDGRTVYINAAKIVRVSRCTNNPAIICQNDNQCGLGGGTEGLLPLRFMNMALAAGECQASLIPEIYTNMYVISYNQDPEPATTDIFGQLLQYWKFNIDIQNCSRTVTQACATNRECPTDEVCQPTGSCSNEATKSCLIDSDCAQGQYCTSKKATIVRDTRRLSDLRNVKDRLEQYNSIIRKYPRLDQGTYLTNRTVSTWPSWDATFASTLGSSLPRDPINKLGNCPGFDAQTCWNEQSKQFAGTADPLAMPSQSHVYYYQYKPTDNSFRFCSLVESGYVQAKTPGSPYCQTGRNCVRNCSNRNCGDDGCGSVCGTCANGQICQSGHCRNISNYNQF